MNDETETEIEQDDWISRSEKKRLTDELHLVARALMKLSDGQRKYLPIEDSLNSAVQLAVKVKSKKEGFRRQMQFVTKLLRQYDIEELKDAMEGLASRHKCSGVDTMKLEALRKGMLNSGDEAVNAFLEKHPGAERQRLRQLIRQANKEKKLDKPQKSSKELLNYIKPFLDKI